MLHIKKYTYGLLLALVSLFTFTACEVEEYDSNYYYTRKVIVGQWRVQEALQNTAGFMPYTPGSVMAFGESGNFEARYYLNGEREAGRWRLSRHSNDQPYLRIELPLPTGRTTILYATIETLNDNYLRLYVEDQDEKSYYTLILTRIY